MKVLLLGDYSMVHRNLKAGLEKLGHEVTLASNGDGWKKLSGADIPLFPKIKTDWEWSRLSKFAWRQQCRIAMNYVKRTVKPDSYDVIQAISGRIFHLDNNGELFSCIVAENPNLFCTLAGEDPFVLQAWKNGAFRKSPFDDNPELVSRFEDDTDKKKMLNEGYRRALRFSKGLIPIDPYENEIPYQAFPNLRSCITYPLDCESIRYEDNRIRNGKLVIYHGINRETDKGSAYICEAMRKLQEKYPNDVECIVTKRIPYDEYVAILQKCNVFVDQCKSYFYGMSGAIAMAQGKIVFSGREPEAVKITSAEECPVFSIMPETKQILSKFEELLDRKAEIRSLGLQGRKYVEKYHDSEKIAGMYLSEWSR